MKGVKEHYREGIATPQSYAMRGPAEGQTEVRHHRISSEEPERMNDQVREALTKDRVIDITTTGRTSGTPTRKEMWFHNLDGKIYITGTPGKRDWYANMVAHPEFTFHLKQRAEADLPARATPITDAAQRRDIFTRILTNIDRPLDQLDAWVASSPLVEVTFQ
jgi:hypothetical protein